MMHNAELNTKISFNLVFGPLIFTTHHSSCDASTILWLLRVTVMWCGINVMEKLQYMFYYIILKDKAIYVQHSIQVTWTYSL